MILTFGLSVWKAVHIRILSERHGGVMMDIILDEARTRGMKVWILDDSHFPTGYCNGKMEDEASKVSKMVFDL